MVKSPISFLYLLLLNETHKKTLKTCSKGIVSAHPSMEENSLYRLSGKAT